MEWRSPVAVLEIDINAIITQESPDSVEAVLDTRTVQRREPIIISLIDFYVLLSKQNLNSFCISAFTGIVQRSFVKA